MDKDTKDTFVKTTIALILASNLLSLDPVLAKDNQKGMEKCYGIAKKGKNACGTPKHACEGQASIDDDPDEWLFVPEGSCTKLGGRLK